MKQIRWMLFQPLKLAATVPMTAAFLATGCASGINTGSGKIEVKQDITVPPFEITTPGGSVNVGGSRNGAAPKSNSSSQLDPSTIQPTDGGGYVERRGDCFIFRDKYGVPKLYQGCPSDMGVPSPIMSRGR